MLKLISNANLYAPEAMGPGHVLTGGGKILYAGPELPEVDPSLLSDHLDLEGAELMPGLIDAHVHSTGGGGEGGFSTQVPAVDLSAFTRHGVTSVVGLLGCDDETRSMANLLARTRALREEGLSAWCWTGGYHVPVTTLTGSVRSDMVHIDCVIGLGELAISDHRSSQPSFTELARLASEVYVGGILSRKAGVLHFHLGDGERGLDLVRRLINETELPANMFHPTHVNRRKQLFEEACELTGLGVTIDLTAVAPTHDGEWSAEDAWELYTGRGLPAGQITVSSDGGGCIPVFAEDNSLSSMEVGSSATLLQWMNHLRSKGHGLDQLLAPLTVNPARLLKLPDKGRIATGFDADLLCLSESGSARYVMAKGEWMVRDHKPVRTGNFESKQ